MALRLTENDPPWWRYLAAYHTSIGADRGVVVHAMGPCSYDPTRSQGPFSSPFISLSLILLTSKMGNISPVPSCLQGCSEHKICTYSIENT